MGRMDCERGNPENAGGLVERCETPPRWLNPRLPIWVKSGPRPNPPGREPKELILCAEEGIPPTRMTIPQTTQLRGGILNLLCNKFCYLKHSARGQCGCHRNVKFRSASCSRSPASVRSL